MELPDFASIYRPNDKPDAMTSDRNGKLNIRGVKPEELDIAIQKLSTPRKNSSPEISRLRIKK